MKEPVVTIKMSYSELQLLNLMVDAHIMDLDEMYQDTGEGEKVSPAKLTLQNQLFKIEEWIDEEKHKALTDKRISKESTKKQAKVETSQRSCVLCDT